MDKTYEFEEGTKLCKKCGLVKDNKDMVKNKNCKQGVEHTCKACRNERLYTTRTKAHAKERLKSAKYRARIKEVPFNLDEDYLHSIYTETCPVFKTKMSMKVRKGGKQNDSISIDRLIPELGYVKGNVVMISMRANWIKSNATLEELKMLVKWLEKEYEKRGIPIDMTKEI